MVCFSHLTCSYDFEYFNYTSHQKDLARLDDWSVLRQPGQIEDQRACNKPGSLNGEVTTRSLVVLASSARCRHDL